MQLTAIKIHQEFNFKTMNVSCFPQRISLVVCVLMVSVSLSAQTLIDKNASVQTKALYSNLKKLTDKGVMFGHQDGDAYGVKWKAEPGRSDVKEVCGSYPAIHGWDLGNLGRANNIDGVDFVAMRQMIKANYDRGSINTISWHVDNPVSKKNAWDTTRAVKHILPGGSSHGYFVSQLDLVADFLANCTSGSVKVPIIFRPYHEHNGNWFWWGKGNCTEQEYIQLWKFTVDYLKNKKNLHHLIYAFSPDRSRMDLNNARASYLYAYPGDDYVDVIGLDDYMDVGVPRNKTADEQQADFVKVLKTVTSIAKEKNKVGAVTETGLEAVTRADWFTGVVLAPLKANPDIKLSYLMVWRNATEKHHYAPYPGHSSETDFKKFYSDPLTLFESDIQNMYTSGKPLVK